MNIITWIVIGVLVSWFLARRFCKQRRWKAILLRYKHLAGTITPKEAKWRKRNRYAHLPLKEQLRLWYILTVKCYFITKYIECREVFWRLKKWTKRREESDGDWYRGSVSIGVASEKSEAEELGYSNTAVELRAKDGISPSMTDEEELDNLSDDYDYDWPSRIHKVRKPDTA